VNTASVTYHPGTFTNNISDTDSWTTNLFEPSVDIEKTGDLLSKVGDKITYTVTIHNTSSADTPDLVLASFSDDLVPVRRCLLICRR